MTDGRRVKVIARRRDLAKRMYQQADGSNLGKGHKFLYVGW
jgi:hypothetical protein